MRYNNIITSSCSNTTTSTSTTTTTTCALPTAPSELVVFIEVGDPSTVAFLEWVPGDGSGSQEVWRSKNGGDYELIDTIPSVDTVYLDPLPQDPSGAVNCYKIRGSNSCGYSSFSTPACGTIP